MRTREEEGVGTVIDTFVVQTSGALPCDPKYCAVKCSSCPPNAGCLHTLICSCSTYIAKSVCEHLHLVLHYQCLHPSNDELSSRDHDYSSGGATPKSRPRDLTMPAQDIGTKCVETGEGYKTTLPQNRIIPEETLEEDAFQNLKKDTINKLGSLIAFLQNKPKSISTQRMLNDLNSYLGNYSKIPNLSKYSTVVTKVNKRKRSIIKRLKEDGKFDGEVKQNTQLTSIEINKVSKVSSVMKDKSDIKAAGKENRDDAENETEKLHQTKHMKLIAIASPSGNNANKTSTTMPPPIVPFHQPPFDAPTLSETLNDSKKFPLAPSKIVNADYFASDYGKRESKQIIGLNAPRYNLLREALRVNVNEYCWCFLICSNVHVTLEALAKEFNIKEREEILEKFILAKSVWSCQKCVQSQKPFEIELILTGYIECRVCSHWFHRSCCDNLDENMIGGNDENFIYICENCDNLQNQTANQQQQSSDAQAAHQQVVVTTEDRKDQSQQQFVVLPSTVNVVDQVDFAMIYE